MGEQPPFLGLGKLYLCSAGDMDKDPKEEYFALDKPVSLLEPGCELIRARMQMNAPVDADDGEKA